ncbi:hypothetical protein BGZ49_010562, partial [Haplosporangium sp. Z 27]
SLLSVQIPSNETVGILKTYIKKEKENKLANIDASDLTLQFIPNGITEEDLEQPLPSPLTTLDHQLQMLEAYFPNDAQDDLIYIVVKLPQQGMSYSKSIENLEVATWSI